MTLPKNLLTPKEWCLPAVIYAIFIIAYILSIIFKSNDDIRNKVYKILMQILVAFLVISIMLIACNSGYECISWIVIIIPIVFTFGVTLGFSAHNNK